jgi:hypothetical protein
VIKRFNIEDLIVQDASGVVFRALDLETGKTVAIRRFFPFGADGGGLHEDERIAYDIAIGRLSGLRHPALRAVVCGGCDPVDGMPFITTEWVEGAPLRAVLSEGPLSTEVAVSLITQALEVCELLSHVLAEEAVWVETDPQTIILGKSSGRPFTFWISPLKWLGGGEENRGLESLVTLTEEIMGWSGRIISDQAGRGLGGWLNWLRGNAGNISLKEARESLAASVGAEPPPPATKLVVDAMRPTTKKPSRITLWIILALGLAIIAAGAWFLLRSPAGAPLKIPKAPTLEQRASERAAALSAEAAEADRDHAEILAGQETAAAQRGGAILWKDNELLLSKKGAPVVVEGIVRHITTSKTRKTIYLLFADEDDGKATRAAISVDPASSAAAVDQLQSYLGKVVGVSGKVVHRYGRLEIVPEGFSAIRLAE